jgi:uncharacterized protein (UPF0335 family)
MKKSIITFIFTFLFSFSLVAQEKKTIWDYPVQPGMEKWEQLQTEKERISAVQVPEEILVKLSSEEIVQLCLLFPSFGYFTAFNTPQEGFNIMLSQFNIFRHLLSKKDVGRSLIDVYKDAGMSGFKKNSHANAYWVIKLDYLELILSQKEILQSLTSTEKIELLLESQKKFSAKIKDESFASLPSLQFTVRIMANILDVEKYQELKKTNKQIIEKFIKTGLIDDPAIMNDIVNMTDNYVRSFNNKKISK